MEEIFISARDGYQLNLHIYEVEEPKGIIQVIHGMEEYQDRYERFALTLNQSGYSVVTSNMRGHGPDAKLLGYFKDHEGYKELLEDQKCITQYILDKYQVDQIILFAHSMGTIIARNLMQSESKYYSKVILSGYPNEQALAPVAILLSSIISKVKGPKYFSNMLEGMAVGTFNKAVKNPRTSVDWLSYNTDNVDAYIASPYCGHGFKVSALNDLFHLINQMHNKKLFKEINDMPILLVSGEDDPCTGGKKGRDSTYQALSNIGFSHIEEKVYAHMRHEILNEKNYQDVEKDIITFLNN